MPERHRENGSGGNGSMEGEPGRSGSISVVELKRVNKIRRDFVANVSHELKTPATSLKLLAESLVDVLGEDPEGARFFADETQLTSMFSNLVENAVKYTPVGGRVEVTAESDESEVVVRVSDTGIGIPEKSLARIFERFYRVDKARSKETGGTGLGLSIVRHIAENHGGRVTVKSVLSEGSTFTVHL